MGGTLLVTAHPDDEAMFFGPSIACLQRQGATVHLLCLSTGDADKQGARRTKELVEACKILNVSRNHITVIDDPQLQDGMHKRWPEEVVAQYVENVVQRCSIAEVVTFDEGGVSGHANHAAVCAGVRHFQRQRPISQEEACRVWLLKSTSIVRKYSFWMDYLLSWMLLKPGQQLFFSCDLLRHYRAMMAHKSQFIWYRKLFVIFSRYSYINVLERAMP